MGWSRLDDGWEADADFLLVGGWQARLLWPILLSRAGRRGGVLSEADLSPVVLAHLSGAPPDDCAAGLAALQGSGRLVRGARSRPGGPGGSHGVEGWLLADWITIRPDRRPSAADRPGYRPSPIVPQVNAPVTPPSPTYGTGRTNGRNRTVDPAPPTPSSPPPPGPRPGPRQEQEQEPGPVQISRPRRTPEEQREERDRQRARARGGPVCREPARREPQQGDPEPLGAVLDRVRLGEPDPDAWDWHAAWQGLGGRGVSPPPLQAPLWLGLAEHAAAGPEQRARVEQLVAEAAAKERPIAWLLACLDADGTPLPPPPPSNGARRSAPAGTPVPDWDAWTLAEQVAWCDSHGRQDLVTAEDRTRLEAAP